MTSLSFVSKESNGRASDTQSSRCRSHADSRAHGGRARSFSHAPGNFPDGRKQHHCDGSERATEHVEL